MRLLHASLTNYEPSNPLDTEFIKTTDDITAIYNNNVITERVQRIRVEQWMKKLCQYSATNTFKATRNKYAKFLYLQIKRGKLQLPFTRVPTDDRLPNLPKYQFDKVRRPTLASSSPKHSSAEKKNRRFLRDLGTVTPKVYNFLQQDIPQLAFQENPALANFVDRPFTPASHHPENERSMFYCRSNSTLLDSTLDHGAFSFFQPPFSPSNKEFNKDFMFQNAAKLSTPTNRHNYQRSVSSINTMFSKREAQSVIYETSQFNRSNTSLSMRPPKFLSSTLLNLNQSMRGTPSSRSSSPKIQELKRKFGTKGPNTQSMQVLELEASNIIDELASRCEAMAKQRALQPSRNLSHPQISKNLTFGAGMTSKRKIKPKMNLNNRINALQKVVELKSKFSKKYCALLKPEVQNQSKTEDKIKQIASKVKRKVEKTKKPPRTSPTRMDTFEDPSFVESVVKPKPSQLDLFETPELDTSVSIMGSERYNSNTRNQLTFAWRSEVPKFESDISQLRITEEEKSNQECPTMETGASQDVPVAEREQIQTYLKYQDQAHKIDEEVEGLFKRRPKNKLTPKVLK